MLLNRWFEHILNVELNLLGVCMCSGRSLQPQFLRRPDCKRQRALFVRITLCFDFVLGSFCVDFACFGCGLVSQVFHHIMQLQRAICTYRGGDAGYATFWRRVNEGRACQEYDRRACRSDAYGWYKSVQGWGDFLLMWRYSNLPVQLWQLSCAW